MAENRFAALREANQKSPEPDIDQEAGKQIPKEIQLAAARALVVEGRRSGTAKGKTVEQTETPLAKSIDPEYMQLKVYVRKATKKAAFRKWEDEGDGDQSNLIESLLSKYLRS